MFCKILQITTTFLNNQLNKNCIIFVKASKKPITFQKIINYQTMEIVSPENWNHPNNPIPYFKVDPIAVLLLGFFTCGLYHIYWNMKIAEVLNAVSEKEIISQPIALFAGCCYPVNFYFFYLIGKEGLPNVYQRLQIQPKNDTTLLIVLGFFFPMIAAMIVQGDINKLYN